jgi:hypothetical protein
MHTYTRLHTHMRNTSTGDIYILTQRDTHVDAARDTHTSQARHTHTQTTCSHTRPVTTKARAGAREGRELRARVPHSSRWRERS